MANDNKEFLKCFGETMDKMLHVGYRKGELVPTGEVSRVLLLACVNGLSCSICTLARWRYQVDYF